VPGYDLRNLTPVIVVGKGAAAAQSYVDSSGANRMLMFAELQKGTSPDQILVLLARQDPGHQTRQYGIADSQGRPLAFTGTGAGAWAGHLTGTSGDLVYAIQGNVLTGLPVVQMAEQAILNTPGDLAEKLMAGMEAARAMGGDGRCSCLTGPPPSCGSPPRQFTLSANIGYMIVARQGDRDGVCNGGVGCATGTYYMNLNVPFQTSAHPDPVFKLRTMFAAWRQSLLGRPDHDMSTVTLAPPDLPADGLTTTTATLVLRDWQSTRIAGSSAVVTVALDPASTATVGIGPVLPAGGGVYNFRLTAGRAAGTALLRVTVDDGRGPVLLSPRTAVEVTAAPLWASTPRLSAAGGGVVDFVLQPGPAHAARPYALLATRSGSSPGIPIPPVVIPLNPDLVFQLSLQLANSTVFQNTIRTFDAGGRATAGFVAPPAALADLLGLDLTFAYATFLPVDFASNAVRVTVGH
jgi:uncharacterized Ntn-hydrolase superfamily protein